MTHEALRRALSDDTKTRYDNACKAVLRNRYILANILKEVVEEFAGYDIRFIAEELIEQESISSTVPVLRNESARLSPGEADSVPENIKGLSGEDSTISEGTIYYDVRFQASYPAASGTNAGVPAKKNNVRAGSVRERIGLVINLEAQNDYTPGYPISTRSVFYTARLLSAQPDTLFSGVDYTRLQKVYSIWICIGTRIPRTAQYTITRYAVTKEDLVGTVPENRRNYDLMTSILLRLNKDGEHGDVRILNLLQDLFNDNLKLAQKQERLKEYDIDMDPELGKEMKQMCNLSQGVFEKGWEAGQKAGILEGRKLTALKLLQDGIPLETVTRYAEVDLETVKAWEKELPKNV